MLFDTLHLKNKFVFFPEIFLGKYPQKLCICFSETKLFLCETNLFLCETNLFL